MTGDRMRTKGYAKMLRERTMRDGMNLRRLPHRLIRVEAALGVNEVRREDGVDEGRLSKTGLTCTHVPSVEILHIRRTET